MNKSPHDKKEGFLRQINKQKQKRKKKKRKRKKKEEFFVFWIEKSHLIQV